jgi:hypothetical protein
MTRHQKNDADLDPQIATELDALERALNGEAGADPVLSELIREVRADVPPFDGPARAALDARVDAGFRRESPGVLARLWPSGPLFKPVLTVAAVAVLGLAVVSSALNDTGGGQDGGGSVSSVAQDSAVPESAPAGDAGAAAGVAEPQADEDAQRQSQAAPPLAPNTGTAPDALADEGAGGSVGSLAGRRRVERSAELSLTAKPADVQGVANDVIRTVQSLGGVVGSSRIATSPDGGEAFFDLRLPTSKLDAAIAQLSKLASVSGLTQDSQDITGSFVSTGDRLQDARDERAALLKALGRAQTDRQVSSLRARIADSRARIAAAQAELRRLKTRTDKATVALTITGDPAAAGGGKDEDEGGAWTPGDAAGDAWRVLEVAAGVAVVAAAALVPLLLLALATTALTRIVRRRARERTLDATA